MSVQETPALFSGKPGAANAYSKLAAVLKSIGPYEIEETKTCLHACAHGAAFLGIHPRQAGLRITIVLDHALDNPRVVKCDKASAKRYHIDLNLSAEDGIDDELRAWIAESYARKNASAEG